MTIPPRSPKAEMANKAQKSRKRHTSGHQQRADCKDSRPSSHRTLQAERNGHNKGGGARQEVTKGVCQLPRIGASQLPGNAAIVVTLLVTLVTVVMRVYYVTLDTSRWLLHPDEIYQSLEVAHSEFYGYGFRTYEYLAPAKGGNLYQQKEQEVGMHALRSSLYPRFYVVVSWLMELLGGTTNPYVVWRSAHVIVSSLLPLAAHLFASSMFQSHDVGAVAAVLVTTSTHLTVLGTHTLVHSFLAPAIFFSLAGLMPLLQDRLARHTRRCSKREGLTLLPTQGSRCTLQKKCGSSESSPGNTTHKIRHGSSCHTKRFSGEVRALPETYKAQQAGIKSSCCVESSSVSSAHSCGKHDRSLHKSRDLDFNCRVLQYSKQVPSPSQNGHINTPSTSTVPLEGNCQVAAKEASEKSSDVLSLFNELAPFSSLALTFPGKFFKKVLSILQKYSSTASSSSFVTLPSLGERSNGAGPDIVSVARELNGGTKRRDIITSDLDRDNALSSSEHRNNTASGSRHDYHVSSVENGGLVQHSAEVTSTDASDNADGHFDRTFRPVTVSVCSFLLAVSCYIRSDSVLLACAVFAPFCSLRAVLEIIRRKHFLGHVVVALFGASVGVIVGIADDFHFYGPGFFSPLNWLKFNVLSNASRLFGVQTASFYLHEVVLNNTGMAVLAGLNVSWMVFETAPFLKGAAGVVEPQRRSRLVRKAGLLACVVFLLGLYSLQQHKEVRFVHHVIVLYLILSAANIWSIAVTITATFGQLSPRVITALFLALFAFSQWTVFPTVHRPGVLKKWVYENNAGNYDVTNSVNFIAAQNDVRGVFIDSNVNLMGGYTSLRHKVPILTLTNFGYYEYALTSWTRLDRKLCLHNSDPISVATFSKISNMFLAENTQRLHRHVLTHKEYNYLVLKANTRFLSVGFKQVFRTKSTKVLKRIGTREEEEKLSRVFQTLKYEPEAEVLHMEARQLYAFGLEELASVRNDEAVQRQQRSLV